MATPQGWDYKRHPNYQRVLATEAGAILEDIRLGKLDARAIWKDLRKIHHRLFRNLVPKGSTFFAGHFRGEPYNGLSNYHVGILSNPLVGVHPLSVKLELSKLDQIISVTLDRLDNLHAHRGVSDENKLVAVVEVACRLFAEFLRIHPFADGNGHVGRVGLVAILCRYGYFPAGFTLEPRPPDPAYSNAVRAYQQGVKEPLHTFVFNCIAGK